MNQALLAALLFGLALLPFCSDDSPDELEEDRLQAIQAVMVSTGDDPSQRVPLGEEYNCTIFPPRDSGLVPVDGTCLWEAEPQGQQWIVKFREVWFCDDFAADDVEGFPPCDGLTGFHEWEYFVDLRLGSVETLSDVGQFPPDYAPR